MQNATNDGIRNLGISNVTTHDYSNLVVNHHVIFRDGRWNQQTRRQIKRQQFGGNKPLFSAITVSRKPFPVSRKLFSSPRVNHIVTQGRPLRAERERERPTTWQVYRINKIKYPVHVLGRKYLEPFAIYRWGKSGKHVCTLSQYVKASTAYFVLAIYVTKLASHHRPPSCIHYSVDDSDDHLHDILNYFKLRPLFSFSFVCISICKVCSVKKNSSFSSSKTMDYIIRCVEFYLQFVNFYVLQVLALRREGFLHHF